MVHRRLHVVVSVVDVAVHVLKRTLRRLWRIISTRMRIVPLHVSVLVVRVVDLVIARRLWNARVACAFCRANALGGNDVRAGVVQNLRVLALQSPVSVFVDALDGLQRMVLVPAVRHASRRRQRASRLGLLDDRCEATVVLLHVCAL